MFDDDDILLGYMDLKIITNVEKIKENAGFGNGLSLNKSVYSGTELLNQLRRDNYGLVPSESTIRSCFQNFIRMSATDYVQLICSIGQKIAKLNTNFRDALPVTIGQLIPTPLIYAVTERLAVAPKLQVQDIKALAQKRLPE